ncbi:PPC domain-containing DNA-binding protein [Microbacterium xanthum]|uniref:PPC domain-containing DNA-binding protein n=1 Tax=Microbacterium xanthum TaxID=3079794 RepID=UPI002AD580E4|nr:PPC domain-containing DNA-binding protein [Microbacterium sp. KSW-48]MDZ8171518.1 DNA-binding protein [Microbacterium sp. KSW-48]
MRSASLQTGRRIAVSLEPGDDLIGSIADACTRYRISQGVIVTLSGAFRDVELIAAQSPSADPEPPLPDSVHIPYTEGIGSGTVTSDADGDLVVHVHLAVGRKDAGARGFAGHVLTAEAHYVVEIVIDEVLQPRMVRTPSEQTWGLPTLDFSETTEATA